MLRGKVGPGLEYYLSLILFEIVREDLKAQKVTMGDIRKKLKDTKVSSWRLLVAHYWKGHMHLPHLTEG